MYQPMYGGGLEERKASLVKRLAGQRAGAGGGARVANPYNFQSVPRRGFSGLAQAARHAPFEAFQDGPGNFGLGVAQEAQAGITGVGPGLGAQSQQAPIGGIGPGAVTGGVGAPQGAPQPGPTQSFQAPAYSQQESSSPWHVLGRYNNQPQSSAAAVPGWVQQQMNSDVMSQALLQWMRNNPQYAGGGGGFSAPSGMI